MLYLDNNNNRPFCSGHGQPLDVGHLDHPDDDEISFSCFLLMIGLITDKRRFLTHFLIVLPLILVAMFPLFLLPADLAKLSNF